MIYKNPYEKENKVRKEIQNYLPWGYIKFNDLSKDQKKSLLSIAGDDEDIIEWIDDLFNEEIDEWNISKMKENGLNCEVDCMTGEPIWM